MQKVAEEARNENARPEVDAHCDLFEGHESGIGNIYAFF